MQESPYLEGQSFLVDKLHQLPFLGSLSEKYIKHILRLSKIRTFEDGEIITPEGAYDSWVYILFSGAVRIVKNGKELTRIEEIGDTFGELAAIDGKARSASVEAIGATVCLAIDASFMSNAAEPLDQALFISALYRLFTEVIAQRLRASNEELLKVRSELEQLKRKQR